MRYSATASPEFVARHFADGLTADSLVVAPSLSFNAKDALQTRWAQALTGIRLALRFHRIPTAHGFVRAACLGFGWGMTPEVMIRDELAQGLLVDLAPDLPLDVPLFWQFNRNTAQVIAPLTQAIKKAASAALLR